jgi:hypothetical protein
MQPDKDSPAMREVRRIQIRLFSQSQVDLPFIHYVAPGRQGFLSEAPELGKNRRSPESGSGWEEG